MDLQDEMLVFGAPAAMTDSKREHNHRWSREHPEQFQRLLKTAKERDAIIRVVTEGLPEYVGYCPADDTGGATMGIWGLDYAEWPILQWPTIRAALDTLYQRAVNRGDV